MLSFNMILSNKILSIISTLCFRPLNYSIHHPPVLVTRSQPVGGTGIINHQVIECYMTSSRILYFFFEEHDVYNIIYILILYIVYTYLF